jgi:hypothetical protein
MLASPKHTGTTISSRDSTLTVDFLTDTELQRMNDIDFEHGGYCHRELLIVWCLHEIRSCHAKGILDHKLAQKVRMQILELCIAIGKMYSIADFPIPVFFAQFICLVTALYLPLFAMMTVCKAGTEENKNWTTGAIRIMVVIL